MRFYKILILIVSVVFVTNCGAGTPIDPRVNAIVEELIAEGYSERDAKCLATKMKKSMPEDLWSDYYDVFFVNTLPDDADFFSEETEEYFDKLLEVSSAMSPYLLEVAEECGVEINMGWL